jgi:hypothetical protein
MGSQKRRFPHCVTHNSSACRNGRIGSKCVTTQSRSGCRLAGSPYPRPNRPSVTPPGVCLTYRRLDSSRRPGTKARHGKARRRGWSARQLQPHLLPPRPHRPLARLRRRPIALALRPEPSLMRADHLAAADAPGEVVRLGRLGHLTRDKVSISVREPFDSFNPLRQLPLARCHRGSARPCCCRLSFFRQFRSPRRKPGIYSLRWTATELSF